MNRKQIVQSIEKHKAVAVLRFPKEEQFEPIFEALIQGGIKVLEITMTVPNALKLIEKAAAGAPDDMIVGAGSVIDRESVKKTVAAGAEFIVSPIVKDEVIDEANKLDKAVLPGAFTPSEIQHAWEAGSDIIKVFPANIVGMAFFKAVKAPLPHLKLMPTGGVSLTNVNEWIESGACAVGIGSSLVDKKAIADGNYDQIRKNAEILIKNIKEN
jgi:2-dehydro-3-deoxyphosphogluconate aldolase / (4S)-4-hydroxy-2-oxoglutarate aldolase